MKALFLTTTLAAATVMFAAGGLGAMEIGAISFLVMLISILGYGITRMLLPLLLLVALTTTVTAHPIDLYDIPDTYHEDLSDFHAVYVPSTGNISFHNIPPTADHVHIFIPTVAMAVDARDVPGVTSWSNTVRPKSYAVYHELLKFDYPLGFEDTLDLGAIVVPGSTLYMESYANFSPYTEWGGYPTITVPEPGTIWIGFAIIIFIGATKRAH